jgi:hypothetical protein
MDDNYILQAAVNNLLYLFDHMPAVPVQVKHDDYFLRKPGVLAFYRPRTKQIVVKPDYLRDAQMPDVIDTLKHELIHAWLHWKGIDEFGEFLDDGHSEWFIKKALEIGVDVEFLLTTPEAVNIYNRVARIYDPFATVVDIQSIRKPRCGRQSVVWIDPFAHVSDAHSSNGNQKGKARVEPSRWRSLYESAIDNTTTIIFAFLMIGLLVGPFVGILWLSSWLGMWK